MYKELNILMLEDQEDDVGLISRVLHKDGIKFKGRRVDTREDFVNALETFRPDIILSDHALPQFNSIEALKLLRNSDIDLPFILVTGTVSEEFAVNCLKLGADDYILKSNLSRLPSSVRQALKQYDIEQKRKIAENNLRSQNEELVKINRELDNFVYSVSHNLRSPMLSVLGLMQIARREDKEQRFAEYWDMVSKSVQQLDDTVKEILNYSRNSRSEVLREKINLETCISEALERLRYVEGFDKIQFEIKVNSSVDFFSDSFRISVILMNLISNAIKYQNPDVVSRVTILASVNSFHAIIKVSDNGIGIQQNLIPRVFEMFFRASEKSEGAGLGLYIVNEAVSKLRGKVDLISDYGSSTTVTVNIPNLLQSHGNKGDHQWS